jgi:hypothetical protein
MKRSSIATAPKEQREAFEHRLIAQGFADYKGLVKWAKSIGLDVSRSAAHRFGQELEERLRDAHDSAEAARIWAREAPDDAGEQNAMILSMFQSDVFGLMMDFRKVVKEENPAKRASMLAKLMQSYAPIANASVRQNKHQIEVRDKVRAAADAVAKVAKKGGMSAAGVEAIKKQIMGIAA